MKLRLLLATTLTAFAVASAPAAAQGPLDGYHDCATAATWTLTDGTTTGEIARWGQVVAGCTQTYAQQMGSLSRAREFVTCLTDGVRRYLDDGYWDILVYEVIWCRTDWTGWPIGKLPPPPPKNPGLSAAAGTRSASPARSSKRRGRSGRPARGRAQRRR